MGRECHKVLLKLKCEYYQPFLNTKSFYLIQGDNYNTHNPYMLQQHPLMMKPCLCILTVGCNFWSLLLWQKWEATAELYSNKSGHCIY